MDGDCPMKYYILWDSKAVTYNYPWEAIISVLGIIPSDDIAIDYFKRIYNKWDGAIIVSYDLTKDTKELINEKIIYELDKED